MSTGVGLLYMYMRILICTSDLIFEPGVVDRRRARALHRRRELPLQRLVGARVIVSRSSDYTDRRTTSCGSVTDQESTAGDQDLM